MKDILPYAFWLIVIIITVASTKVSIRYAKPSIRYTKPKIDKKQEEYISAGGTNCPYCGSTDIDGNGVDFDDNEEATEEVECNQCKKRWIDTYELTGFMEE